MKRLEFLIILFCACCTEIKNELAKAVLENSNMLTIERYDYEFTSDQKIKSQKLAIYTVVNGVLMDSTLVISSIEYDDKNRMIEKANKVVVDETEESNGYDQVLYLIYPPRILYSYNNMDSVISEYELNQSGDTIYSVQKEFDGNRLKVRKVRSLQHAEDPSKIFDTTYLKYNYEYAELAINEIIIQDHKDQMIEKVEFIYDDTLLISKIKYSYLFDEAIKEESTEYDYSSGLDKPVVTYKKFNKYLSDMSTSRIRQNLHINGQDVHVHFDMDEGAVDSTFYDSKGQMEKIVGINTYSNTKTLTTFLYDDKGYILEKKEETTPWQLPE